MPGILIVDDSSSIRYLLRVFVESKTAFTVCGEACHGTDAIEKAKQLHPDLILLDLSMPVLSGSRGGIDNQEDDARGEDHSVFNACR